MMNKDERVKRAKSLLVVAAILTTIYLGVYLSTIFATGEFECKFLKATGFFCPGCGGTRMCKALLKLNFYQAFRWNILLFISIPLIAIIAIKQTIVYIMENRIYLWLDKFLIIYTVVVIVFGILRNTEAFNYLAPTLIN